MVWSCFIVNLNSPWPICLSKGLSCCSIGKTLISKGSLQPVYNCAFFTALPPNNTMQNTQVLFGKQTSISKPVGEFQSGARPTHPHTGEHLGLLVQGTPAPFLKSQGLGHINLTTSVTIKYRRSWSRLPGLVARFGALGCPQHVPQTPLHPAGSAGRG